MKCKNVQFVDIWKPPAESCFCFESNLLCGEANLTEIPMSSQGVSIFIKLRINQTDAKIMDHTLIYDKL